MPTVDFCFFPSYEISSKYEDKCLLPQFKIFCIDNFIRENFRFSGKDFNDLGCLGELTVQYCVTQRIPNISGTKITAWTSTAICNDDENLNHTFTIPFPYSHLTLSNGISFIVSTKIFREGNYETIYLAGTNFNFYNSKGIFRHGIYELVLHPFDITQKMTLRDVEHKLFLDESLDHKPKDLDELKFLMKRLRKLLRNEMFQTPLDKNSFPLIEKEVAKIKKESGRLFMSIKVDFSSDFPDLYVPVVFQRSSLDGAHTPIENWNPVDEKYFVMTRNPRTVDFDREKKPNKETLISLRAILEYPPGVDLKEIESDLIWKYRFFLANKYPETALAKFVLSVRWEYQEQANQAESLLKKELWQISNPEIALQLLTKQFTNPIGRRFAITLIEFLASDEEIKLYLFQLVQSIRYENWNYIVKMTSKKISLTQSGAGSGQEKKKSTRPDLTSFLIQRCSNCKILATRFFWYLQIELGDEPYPFPTSLQLGPTGSSQHTFIGISDVKIVFRAVMKRFMDTLRYGNAEKQSWHDELVAQTKFVNELKAIMTSVKFESGNRLKKIEILKKKLISDEYGEVSKIKIPFAFPLDPEFTVFRVDSDSATLFKSSLNPALLTLIDDQNREYRTIFKYGDDLRQDQLILQLIALMDNILQRENFDLKLSPYKVMATGPRDGFVQFLESKTLSAVLKNGSILTYLQENNPSPKDLLGVSQTAMENYTRSCAGYCVITYLLGIGDRHMDNVLLTPDGRLFHIDFGYILGNDPKIMACEVRLTRQMLDALGGPTANYFQEFWQYCSTSFLILRRHANLLMTMFSLVQDAEICDIAKDPVKAIDWLKEKFCLGQSEERALSRLEMKMTEAVKAFAPDLIEKFHSLTQYIRA